jgi:hypothetical protein
MNHPLGRSLSALCFLALATPLVAQSPPSPADPDPGQSVTVVGERPDGEEQRRREAARFVDSHAVRTRIGQYARWHEPICVRTWGLPLALNARLSNRVMDIAESLDIPTNRADPCRPNVRIGFTTSPQAMIERAVRRNRQIIGFHYAARRDQVMRVRQPVQAWYVTTTRTGESTGVVDDAGVQMPSGAPGSRLTNYISSGLAHVLIFTDSRLVADQDADAIAELLAFLALAQTPVAEACDESATILNLMNPACPPERRPVALTGPDIAYLRALYRTDPEAGEQMQRGAMVLNMAEMLGNAPASLSPPDPPATPPRRPDSSPRTPN